MKKSSVSKIPTPETSARLQQIECTHDVCLNKIVRSDDGSIHVRLCGQMHHMRDFVPSNDFRDTALVPQVHLLEGVLRMAFEIAQVFQVARVSQTVEVDQPAYFRFVDDVSNQIGPDKPCATSYQKIHSTPFNSPARLGPGPPWLMARPSPDSTAWRLTS